MTGVTSAELITTWASACADVTEKRGAATEEGAGVTEKKAGVTERAGMTRHVLTQMGAAMSERKCLTYANKKYFFGIT